MAEVITDGECALGTKPRNGTCLSPEDEKKILKATNAGSLEEVKEKFDCRTDGCILKKVNTVDADEIKRRALKAEGPAYTKELISNFNISDIFNQFMHKYPDFHGYEFQYHDFANHSDTEPLKNPPNPDKKKMWGMIVNTDVTGGPGIHWFAIFIDFRKDPWTIEYFNSSGNKPQFAVHKWLRDIKSIICRQNGGECKLVLANDKFQHQRGNTECGLYSMYYIWSRLQGIPYEEFANRRIPDSLMTQFRKQLFM